MNNERVNVNVVDEAGRVETGSIPTETYKSLPYMQREGYRVFVTMDDGYMIEVHATRVYKR